MYEDKHDIDDASSKYKEKKGKGLSIDSMGGGINNAEAIGRASFGLRLRRVWVTIGDWVPKERL